MFKSCTTCQKSWESIESFLADPHIKLMGYQANFDNAALGLFLFNHEKENCHSTLGIQAHEFQKLLAHPLPLKRFIPDTVNCPGFCHYENNFEYCHNPNCPGSEVRKLLQIIRQKLNKLPLQGPQ